MSLRIPQNHQGFQHFCKGLFPSPLNTRKLKRAETLLLHAQRSSVRISSPNKYIRKINSSEPYLPWAHRLPNSWCRARLWGPDQRWRARWEAAASQLLSLSLSLSQKEEKKKKRESESEREGWGFEGKSLRIQQITTNLLEKDPAPFSAAHSDCLKKQHLQRNPGFTRQLLPCTNLILPSL